MDPGAPFANIISLATLKLAIDANRVRESAHLLILPYFVLNALTPTLNSRAFLATNVAPGAASVRLAEPLIEKKFLYPYPEAVSRLSLYFADCHDIVGMNSAVSAYTNPASLNQMGYVNDL